MYLQKFPDIQWLRKNAAQNFSQRKDLRGNLLSTSGWPNVILNTKSSHTERDNIVGPFSFFYNLSGLSRVRIDKSWYRVSDGFYCISNKGQTYDLHVPKDEHAETFNIHFGQSLYEDVIQQVTKTQQMLLDGAVPDSVQEVELLPKTDLVSQALSSNLMQLQDRLINAGGELAADLEYELTSGILELILSNSLEKLKKANNINSVKSATRQELFRRINVGLDYIHDNRLIDIDLDGICQASGLSKFHFIRVFKEAYGLTPTSYLSKLKLRKAIEQLEETENEISDIGHQLGFSELSAFSRFIKKETGKAPSFFRVSN